MTAFISEFRSMTFQCKSEISSSIQFSEINNFIGNDRMMAPQQHDAVAKTSDRLLDAEQARENRVSPISSLGGRSMESSSPAMLNDGTSENMNQNYEIDHSQLVDPSSDDSGSIQNDLPNYQELQSPLEQLQCALGKDGMLGQKLHLSEYPGQKDDIRNSSNASLSSAEQSCIYYENGELYKCHLCTFSINSKQEFNVHMNSHFDHKCPFCDYTSRTEGRLKRHVKDFHSETPPESWAGTRIPRTDLNGTEHTMDDSVTSSNGKSRTYRCKQCDFIAYQKSDFGEHNKTHIKADKLLSCPQCAFVTEYKHHLEYHIRNHFGSKPFKCSKCNYSCVNKSMLNSHMKSHSNIYQYRCANCTYATKYCHSLKLHLRKYDHKPATVLNLDGTPNPYPVIDVYGTRRGPRTKKRRCLDDSENNSVSSTAIVPNQPSINYAPGVPLMSTNVPMMYPSQFFNGYPSNIYMKPHQPTENSGYSMAMQQLRVKHDSPLKCMLCDFVTDHKELYHKHMILHAAAENQDIVKLYGINSDSLLHFQDQMAFNSYLQSQRHYMEHLPRSEEKNFEYSDILKEKPLSKYEFEGKNIKHEEENNLNYLRETKNSSPQMESKSPKNESTKKVLTPSYSNIPHSISPQDQENSEDNERSVIVTHKSLANSSVEHMEIEASNSNIKNVEHSPLDLSGSKTTDSTIRNIATKSNLEKPSLDLKSSSPNTIDASGCQRNRRKGKAFKIDHYIHYDDQPLNAEILSKENDANTTLANKNEKLKMNSNEDITLMSIEENQNSLPMPLNGSNKSLLPQAQNTHFKILNSVNAADKNGYSSQFSHQSSQEEVSNVFNKTNPSITPRISSQIMKERNLRNSLPEPNFQPKLEADVDKINSLSTKRQEIFECEYCAMAFRDCVMYTIHMGYHGFGDPFTCNMCGQESKDRVEFFIHIARAAHA